MSEASRAEPRSSASPRRLGAVLVLALLVAAGGAWAWRGLDGRLPRGDEARHLISATRAARGEWLFPDPALTYPPLGYWVQAALGGGSPQGAPLAQAAWLLVTAVALGAAGRALAGEGVGFLAGLLALTSPLLTVVLRTGYVDMALLAAVSAAFAFLVRSHGFSRPGDSALAGFCTGAAALCKFGFPLYLGVPVLLTLLGWPRREGAWRAGTVLFSLTFLGVAAPWYLAAPRIFERMGQFLGGRFYVPSADAPGSAGAFLWVGWTSSEWLWGLPLGLAVLAGLGLGLARREGTAVGLAACILAPLLALALLPHRGPHYALPVLAFSALLGALPLARSRFRAWFAGLALLLVLYAAAVPLVAVPARGPDRDVLFEAFCMVCPAGRLEMLPVPALDPRSRPVEALVRDAAALAGPLPPGESALYPVAGSASGATIALVEPLPPDLEDEALRYQILRSGAALRVGVLGQGLEPWDADLYVVASDGVAFGGMAVAGRYAFPGGEVRLWRRR